MENYFKKNINNIIGLFLIISPILDLATGLNLHNFSFPLTIGMIVRMIFLIIIFMITFFYFHKKKVIIPYLIVFIFSLFFILSMFIYNEEEFLFREIQNLIKTFYFPLLFISLFSIRKEIRISNLTLFTTLFLYLILLFIPISLGFGYKSYEITKAGTLGFFNSANEISGIISILIPILFIILKESKKKIPVLIILGIYLVVILTIGTKTPLLAFFFVLVAILIQWFKKKEIKKIKISLLIILISIISLSIIIPKTNFYKNIKTHLDFLGVNNVIDVFQKPELIDHFIFSQRLSFLKQKSKIYHEANTYQKLFGIGAYQNDLELKAIEMDYFDIYYNYGIIGFLIFLGIVSPLLYKILKTEKEKSEERYMLKISLLLIIILSFFTGHIIVSPTVSLIVTIIILSINDEHIKRYFVAGKNLNEKQKEFINKNKDKNIKILLEEDLKKNHKIKFLFFKILNYQNYDLSIYLENDKELGKEECRITSKNNAIFLKKEKELTKEYNWIILEEKPKQKENYYLYYEDELNI